MLSVHFSTRIHDSARQWTLCALESSACGAAVSNGDASAMAVAIKAMVTLVGMMIFSCVGTKSPLLIRPV